MNRVAHPILTRRTLLAASAVGALSFLPTARAADPEPDKPYLSWFNPPAKPVPLLAHHGYDSPSMRTKVGYNLYLPPGYETEATARRYPVVYWLHGRGQSENTDQFPPAIVDAAIRDRTIPPLIVVYASGGANSWYADSPDGKHLAETTVVRELIPHVDATYRTIAGREGRAIQGMSMGGRGAVKFALKYPELFSSVVAFAPSFRTATEMDLEAAQRESLQRMFAGDADRFMADHPAAHLRKNVERVRGKLGIKLLIGTKDRDVLLNGCRRFHALLDELKVPHDYAEVEGVDHNLPKLAAAVRAEGLAFAAKHFGTL